LLGCVKSCTELAPEQAQSAMPSPESNPQKIVFLGDSLTAGYGLESNESYPALIQEKLRADQLNWEVVNAGVSGDTTQGGLERVPWVLKAEPKAVFVALGANDGLRGISPQVTKSNLKKIIELFQSKSVTVYLGGMRLPLNYGKNAPAFEAVFTDLASEYKIPLLPFLIEGVALDASLNLPDGIHPNAKGAKIVAGNVYNFLKPLLEN
jgi:acyl-CoA thioesterase I